MANFLPPTTVENITSLLASGFSVRETAAKFGVSKATVSRYRKVLLVQKPSITCICGKAIGHQGWCSWRLQRSPSRVAFLRNWGGGRQIGSRAPIERAEKTPLLNYPFMIDARTDEARLVMMINAAVPRALPEHIRQDVCQDLLVAYFEGQFVLADLAANVGKFLRRHRRLFEDSKFRFLPFDVPLRADGRPLSETLTA